MKGGLEVGAVSSDDLDSTLGVVDIESTEEVTAGSLEIVDMADSLLEVNVVEFTLNYHS